MQIIKVSRYALMLVRNIIFQGVLYMSVGEKIYKLSITCILTLTIYKLFTNLWISLLTAHLLNYIINGQFYVVYRYLDTRAKMRKADLIEYFVFIENNILLFRPLDVLIIGSIARGSVKSTSDLDLRIYHNKNILDSIKAYIMATKLRLFGLVTRFPIDVYCFSDLKFLDKINNDEVPVNFLNDRSILKKYPKSIYYKEHSFVINDRSDDQNRK
jgi:predicted nucleotidyltransferase